MCNFRSMFRAIFLIVSFRIKRALVVLWSTMNRMSGDINKHHMWMWFHTTLDDTVLFDFWLIDAPWSELVLRVAYPLKFFNCWKILCLTFLVKYFPTYHAKVPNEYPQKNCQKAADPQISLEKRSTPSNFSKC